MARIQRVKPRIIVKKKGGFMGKIVAFLMGMLMGISALIGSVAAVGYFVLKKPLNEIFSTIESTGSNIPGDILDYVSADMATLPLLDVLKTVGVTAIGLKDGANTLGDLAGLSPFLDKNIGNLAGKLSEFGIYATKEEFLALNLTNAGGYFLGKIYDTPIADIINAAGDGVPGDNALMCSLYYGKKGVHYTVTDENKAVALPLTYVLSENVFTDWDKKVFEKIGEEWVHENISLGVKTVIKEYQAAPTNEGGLTYSYEVYTVSGEEQTLLYQLVQDVETPSNYHAYQNGVIQKHKGLTIGAVIQGADVMGMVNQMELFNVLSMNSSTPSILLSLAGYEKDEQGLPVLKEGKSATTISDLKGQNATNLINEMKISEVLSLSASSDPIMLSLAHGNYTIDNGVVKPEIKEGEPIDRTIADLINDGGAQELIQTLKLPVVLKLNNTSNKLLLKIAYGKGYSEDASGKPVLNDSDARSVADLTKGDFLDTLTIGDVIDTTKEGTPQILKYLAGATIGGEGDNTITAKINDLRLVNAIGEEQCNSSTILSAMKDWRVNEFGTKVKELRLSQIVDTTSPNTPLILQSLADAKISGDDSDPDTIKNKVNALTLSQVIGEDKINGNFILKHLKDSTLVSMNKDIAELTVEDVFATDVYKMNGDKTKFLDANGNEIDETEEGWESKRVLTGTWKYLLTDVKPNTREDGKHNLSNMAVLIENMTGNVNTANLSQLDKDGILDLTDSTLTKPLSPGNAKTIGDLTIKELVDAFGTAIN